MDNKGKNVRVALCDNHWWQAELKRGYLYGQDSIEDRPPHTPPPYQNAWYFSGGILFQKGECYAQIYRMFPGASGTYDDYRCHYQPRWENIKVSRTARNVVEYMRKNPTHKCS